MDDLNCDASFSWMLATHEAMEIFINPRDIISTSLYFWMSKWLNATNASITLQAGDSVITLYLIINALEQQAVPSIVRWMHGAQRGCWITAALQAGWELMGTEPLRLEGSGTSMVSHSRQPISTLLQGWRLHNWSEQPVQLHWATCSRVKSSSHQKRVFLTFRWCFLCFSLCWDSENECTRHRQGGDR